MPLEIVKVQVKDLQYNVSLDDSMAMMPEMRLSAFTEVIVGARVSKSGAAKPAAGDLEGASAKVSPGADGVTVAIKQVVREDNANGATADGDCDGSRPLVGPQPCACVRQGPARASG